MPTIRTTLERAGLPIRFFSHAMQVITKKSSFDVLAKFACRFMSCEGNDADRVALGRLPLPVKPRTRDNGVRVVGIVLRGVPENLPRAPGIFLVPESSYVQVR